MPSIPAIVEPSLLQWARVKVDLTAVAAARKIGVPDDRVAEWEAGERLPTVAELKKAAKVYNRALGVFYLPAPPEDFDTLRDFRRRPGGTSLAWSVALHAEYQRAHDQRDNMLELFELEEVEPSNRWVVSDQQDDDEELASLARSSLLTNAPYALPGSTVDRYAHLNAWTAALETAGVLVLSTQGGRVDPEEMAAFSLYFDTVPVIVVNGADWPRGRLFSLLHEFAHLIVRSEGLCDTYRASGGTGSDARVEARCNDLAARILMPKAEVLSRALVQERVDDPMGWDYEALAEAAAPFGVSAESFLRRLVTLGLTTQSFYSDRRQDFLRAYREREQERRQGKGGGNYYYTKARDLGRGYVRVVDRARRDELIDRFTAARMLDAKVNQVDRLAKVSRLP